MARRVEVQVVGDTKSFEKAMDRAGGKAKSFGKTAAKAFGGLAIAGVAGAAIGIKKTVDAASNLGESMNAVNVVFGKSGKIVTDFAKTAAKEAGLSARAFNELVTPIGAMLINTGMGADEAAKASINLGKRAADMASVFNVDVSEALGAIQAGLRGEADPLERFGVGLSAAAVKSKAVELGLIKTGGELDANGKAQARLALLMEQTDRVAGDFVNTSDSLANSQRIANAQWENAQAKIGQVFLPIATKAMNFISEQIIPALSRFAEFAGPHLADAFGKLKGVAEDVWPAIRDTIQTVVGVITSLWQRFGDDILAHARRVWSFVSSSIKVAIENIRDIIQLVVAIIKGDWGRAWEEVKGIAGRIWGQIKNLFKLALDGLKQLAKLTWEAIKLAVTTQWGLIRDALVAVWNGIKTLFTTALNALKALWSAAWTFIKTKAGELWGGIKTVISTALDAIVGFLGALPGRLWGALKGAWDTFREGVLNAFLAIRDFISSTVVDRIVDFFRGLPDRIWNAIRGGLATMKEHVLGVFRGLRDQVIGIWNSIKDKLVDIGNAILPGNPLGNAAPGERPPPMAGAIGPGLHLPGVPSGTHPTSGLPGYPATDYLAPAGTPVFAPFSGTISKLSGSNTWRDGFGGLSVYITGSSGQAFLTHFGPNLAVGMGQTVQQGQLLGFVGAPTSGMAPHIHYGLNTFHQGGVVPGRGQVPAMLLGGEGVFTREQMAAMGGVVVNVRVEGSIWQERDVARRIRDEIIQGIGTANPRVGLA